jgi:uncharacterized RDD family membrane protein YckC
MASSRLLPPGLVFSDTPSRAIAYVLDSIAFTVINSVPLSILGFYNFTYPNLPDRSAFVAATLFGFLIHFAYFVWFWSGGRRATPGQRVFGIQVGNAFDGRPLTSAQGVRRWVRHGAWLAIPPAVHAGRNRHRRRQFALEPAASHHDHRKSDEAGAP